MVDLAKLDELIARVEKATSSDRELDIDLAKHFGRTREDGVIVFAGFVGIGSFTSDVHSAMRFVEATLPGWTFANMQQQDDKTWFCELREGFLTSYNRVAMSDLRHDRRPPTLPLAILQAAMEALRESSEKGR